ncbi:2-oxo-tetronate isomerase [Lichenicoccus sp.]|uniref:2-oxo-tetronate isomerase n=1 Tax=Lichenicoccus sp. TaxID=2781899 RepID=UPI003D0D9521
MMPDFAANLTMMFTEHEFLDRFDAAAEAGFDAVEFLFPYDHTPEAVAERVLRNELTVALFNLPPGDWAAGDRGLAALPSRQAELRDSVARARDYAQATGVGRLHLMAGLAPASDPEAGSTYRNAVRYCAEQLAGDGIDLLLEPINSRDMPGYFLNHFGMAERIIAETGPSRVKLQFDLYHHQIMHGDVTMALRRLLPITGHIQVASVPSRHEPDNEELNWPFLFGELDRLGYGGFVGCEYRPRAATRDGLGWFRPYAAPGATTGRG